MWRRLVKTVRRNQCFGPFCTKRKELKNLVDEGGSGAGRGAKWYKPRRRNLRKTKYTYLINTVGNVKHSTKTKIWGFQTISNSTLNWTTSDLRLVVPVCSETKKDPSDLTLWPPTRPFSPDNFSTIVVRFSCANGFCCCCCFVCFLSYWRHMLMSSLLLDLTVSSQEYVDLTIPR